MRWMQLLLGAWLGWCVACSSARDNGQTGSAGIGCNPKQCQADAEQTLADINQKSAPEFVDSVCERPPRQVLDGGALSPETLVGQTCKCIARDGSHWSIRAEGALFDGGLGCLAWGRGHQQCVYSTADEVTCDPTDARSCDTACARLQQGYAEDAARTYETELRLAECRESPAVRGAYLCATIARINGACYTRDSSGFLTQGPYDCSLSNDEILARGDFR